MKTTNGKRGRPTKAEQAEKKAHEFKQQQHTKQADAVLSWAEANTSSLALVCDVLRLSESKGQGVAIGELHRMLCELLEVMA